MLRDLRTRRNGLLVWSTLAVGLAGCSQRLLALAAQDGDLVVLATVAADGEIVDTRVIPAGDPTLEVELETRSEEAAVAFVVTPSTDLYATQGVLPPLKAVANGTNVGCGRCLSRAQEPPLFAIEGSVCPVPSWVRAVADPESVNLEAIRSRVLLAFDGPCPCVTPSVQPFDLRAEIITPEEEWPYTVGTVRRDGTGGLFGYSKIKLFDAQGTRELALAVREPPLSVAGVKDGFVLLSARGENLSVRMLDANGVDTDRRFDAEAAAAVRSIADSTVVVVGARWGTQPPPLIRICSTPDLTCSDVGSLTRRGVARDAAVTRSGSLVVSMNRLGALVYDKVPVPGTVRNFDNDTVVLESGEIIRVQSILVPVEGRTRVGVLGDRAYICGENGNGEGTVYTASVAPALDPEFELVLAARNQLCVGFVKRSEDAIWALLTNEVVELDRNGQVRSRQPLDEAVPGTGSTVWWSFQGGEHSLLGTAGADWWTLGPAGDTRVHGTGSWRQKAKLLSFRDDLWLVGQNHISPVEQREPPPFEPGFSGVPRSVTEAPDGIAVLDDDGIQIFNPSDRTVRSFARFSLDPPPPNPRVDLSDAGSAMTRLGADGFLVVTVGDPISLMWIRPDAITPVTLPHPEPGDSWDAVQIFHATTSAGIAFVAAAGENQSLMLRVTPGPDGATAERVRWLDSGPKSVAALCPDHALVVNDLAATSEIVEIRESDSGLTTSSRSPLPAVGTYNWVHMIGSTPIFAAVVTGSGTVSLRATPDGSDLILDGWPNDLASGSNRLGALMANGAVWQVQAR